MHAASSHTDPERVTATARAATGLVTQRTTGDKRSCGAPFAQAAGPPPWSTWQRGRGGEGREGEEVEGWGGGGRVKAVQMEYSKSV